MLEGDRGVEAGEAGGLDPEDEDAGVLSWTWSMCGRWI